MRKDILDFIIREIEDYNEELENPLAIGEGEACVLFGKGSVLDSVDLVRLIVAIEQEAEDHFNRSIDLMDERAMSQKNSPFRTVGTLVDYISNIIEEK